MSKAATTLIPDMLSLLRRNRVDNAEPLLTDLVDQLSTQCFNNDQKRKCNTKQQKDSKKDEKIPEENSTTAAVGEIFTAANMHKVSLTLTHLGLLFNSYSL